MIYPAPKIKIKKKSPLTKWWERRKKLALRYSRGIIETYDFRESVRQRDGHACRLCGDTKRLHVHHIEGRSGEKNIDVQKAITLCVDCHRMVHCNQKRWRQVLRNLVRIK